METPAITATTLSHYIRLERCERYLRLRLRRDEAGALFTRFRDLEVIEQPLTPLLRASGQRFETEIIQSLPSQVIDLHSAPTASTCDTITGLPRGATCFLVQAPLEAQIAGRWCIGRADIIRVTRRADESLELLIIDIKASQTDHVEYRLQVAFYSRLLRAMLAGAGIADLTISGAILKAGDAQATDPIDHPDYLFDLTPYEISLTQLLEGGDSDIAQVLAKPFAEIRYSLSYKCDSCMFNQLCLVESAARQDITLVPFIQSAEVQALHSHGIQTLTDLVGLKTLPGPAAWNIAFAPVPSQEAQVATLSAIQPLGARLDRLVQRARAILRRYDPSVTAYGYLLDGTFSQLPADDANPDLVKIFLDAQQDYVQGRVYLVGALVRGPQGEKSVVHMSPHPPTVEDEQALLLALLQDVLAAVPTVARDPLAAPLHLYVYDSYEQKVWLDALARHLDALTAVPAFYDLLTTSPALDQLMISVISAEVRDRRNLAITCQNLYSVATALGFKWRTEQDDFRRLFYLRVFDNSKRRPDSVWIEKASRFHSHIPLEYAYGAWGELPDDPSSQALIGYYYYRRCSPDAIARFQAHRLQALAYIERALGGKNKHLVKEPVPLGSLGRTPPPPAGLARALEEFLAMEHHSVFQERLALFALPIERRMQTGRALLLLCSGVAQVGSDLIAHFKIDFAGAGLDATAGQAMRVKEGDWMVLNPVDQRSPWAIVHGRIGIVSRLEDDEIAVQLLDLTHYRSQFKYSHDTALLPEPDASYTLDEMADDLNFDKYLEAIRHTTDNTFFAYLAAPPADDLSAPTGRARQFLDGLRDLEKLHPLTSAQEQVIGGHAQTPLLCVQGPPGTGKTATLGWAVLARLFARDDRPLRVAVCARTHKATNLVLQSIAARLARLRTTRLGRALGPISLYKVGGEGRDELPDGVHGLNLYQDFAKLEAAFSAPIAIMGATPGGLHTLVRQRFGKTIDWSAKLFDLVIIDEASQMSLPEAVLAGAFLKPDGQMLVVGDHRQMPPILAHTWDRERKRTSVDHQPYRSVFESLLDRDCPVVRLDESFRLHRVQAEFLAKHIYIQDGFTFHSRRQDLLPPLPASTDDFTTAALRPDYPVVVIEHGEETSQQYNPVEIALADPLIAACVEDLHLNPQAGIGVVVPHRAQKAALREHFPLLAAADAIDTVERFQGGERDVILVSATASDPGYVLSEATFLLNRNRLNVAISRPRLKLIVLASRTVFRMVLDDLDLFEHALLWKRLRYGPEMEVLWAGTRAGYPVRMLGRPCGHPLPAVVPVGPTIPPAAAYVRRERRKEKW